MKTVTCRLILLVFGLVTGGLLSLWIPVTFIFIVATIFLPALFYLYWFLKQHDVRHEKPNQAQYISQQIEIAVNQERERIYRNLHDDIGAQLLNLVFKAKDAEAADIARVTLQNMREVIAKTIDKKLSVTELLGDIRMEMECRLEGSSISLQWDVPFDMAEKPLQANQIISISRIFREGLSNVLKHSKAGMVIFSAKQDGKQLILIMADDGMGLTGKSRGQGIRSMQQRADNIGAQLVAGNADRGGFQVKLIL